jgi:hypothetical protein
VWHVYFCWPSMSTHTTDIGVLMIWWWAGGCRPFTSLYIIGKPDGLLYVHTVGLWRKGQVCQYRRAAAAVSIVLGQGDEKKGTVDVYIPWALGDMVITVARAPVNSNPPLTIHILSLRYYDYDGLKLFFFLLDNAAGLLNGERRLIHSSSRKKKRFSICYKTPQGSSQLQLHCRSSSSTNLDITKEKFDLVENKDNRSGLQQSTASDLLFFFTIHAESTTWTCGGRSISRCYNPRKSISFFLLFLGCL